MTRPAPRSASLQAGSLVHVRSRRWLVDEVIETEPGRSPLVRMSCADDDAQGQELTVYWDYELDKRVLDEEAWHDLGAKGFDPPDRFAAFLHTLNWNTITATDASLFQAPFRAGIKIDAYQMEPLRKALRLPRVNLFIADDTGLGKTIEAGLIARELLLRKKVKTILVAAPPAVLEQWKAELEERFGLTFEVLDRHYFARVRRERGFGVNPWRTHSRFLVSHNLLIDPTYTDPLREWLGTMQPGSLLILDEAHHAAPASGNRYGIETKFTRAIRDLSGRFEHRLFLSATPHNGHSSSFSTLLELLDPYRFTRGVHVRNKKALDEVMVRRLKEDIRAVQGGFPKRKVVPIVIGDLPDDAPEIQLSRLLDEYRQARERRFAMSTRRTRASAGLLVVGLQQRLLSSIDAFARTLDVHRETVERHWAKGAAARDERPSADDTDQHAFLAPADADDDRAEWSDEALEQDEAAQVAALTTAEEESSATARDEATIEMWRREQELLDRMQAIAGAARREPGAKLLRLVDWIRTHMVPDLPSFGELPIGDPPTWNDRRLIIFTENRQGTKTYLRRMLEQAIAGTDLAEERINVIEGPTSGPKRKEIQRRFNAPPDEEPLRILIATDAAREGLNLQGHCADLFHFDLPWNPGRIEQRNGRIDRKLQPAGEVRCHYFVLPQRVEDRVLQVLVNKTETIRQELGSLSRVIDAELERSLAHGIRHDDADNLADRMARLDIDEDKKAATREELDIVRDRQDDLKRQVARCQNLLDKSRRWVNFDEAAFRNALSASLELIGSDPLTPFVDEDGRRVWEFPALDQRAHADPTWAATLDTLRAPRKHDQKITDWRKEAPIRPVVFEDAGILTDDVVHLHLEQRVAQRLLARFRAQGFVHHDLSRAVLAQSRDAIPRVVLLGRLSLYGQKAERLHEEIVPLTARWNDPERRDGPLQAYARDRETMTLDLLDQTLVHQAARGLEREIQERLQASVERDIEDLRPQLEQRAETAAKAAAEKLRERGEREARTLVETLTYQQRRVQEEIEKYERTAQQGMLAFADEERQQLDANARFWRTRLQTFERDLDTEPDRIRAFYEVRASRVEPVGLAYLWPESN